MKIAYLINRYPAPSHAFIRREILALQAGGQQVLRVSIRRHDGELEDQVDRQELADTRVLLDAGAIQLAFSVLVTVLTRPLQFFKALAAACALGRSGGRGILVHLVYLAEACLLRRWLSAERIEHMHAHFGTNPAAVACLCRMLGGPGYSFTVHGPEEFDHPRELGLEAKMAGARFVVAISEFGRSQLYRWASWGDWDKIHVVRCGVDEEFLAGSFTPPSSHSRLVCVGRLCAEKGHAILLKAAAQIFAKGITFELVLIGDGPLRGELEKMVRELGLDKNVRFLGWQSGDSIKRELLDARAMVLASFAEGLPVVLMESLALCRPVITTQIAGIPELVKHRENGWLIPPGNVDALAKAMEEALSIPVEHLAQFGNAGAKRVRERHDAVIEAGKLRELFHRYVPQSTDSVASRSPSGEHEEVIVGARA